MGVLAFISDLQNRRQGEKELELQHKYRMDELEARRQHELELERVRSEQATNEIYNQQNAKRNSSALEEVNLARKLAADYISQGMDPSEATLEADRAVRRNSTSALSLANNRILSENAYLEGSIPFRTEQGMAETLGKTRTAQATETASRRQMAGDEAGMELEPEVTTSGQRMQIGKNKYANKLANFGIQKTAGAMPFAETSGAMEEQESIGRAIANLTGYAVDAQKNRGMFPQAANAGETSIAANIAGNTTERIKAEKSAQELSAIDPTLSAEAINARNRSTSAVSKTTQRLGLDIGPLSLQDPFSPWRGALGEKVNDALKPPNFTEILRREREKRNQQPVNKQVR